MKIQMKLSVFMGSLLLVLVVLMVVIGTWVINTIIYGLNTELLSLKLDARLQEIETTIQLIEDSGVTGIATYVQQAQHETLQQFQAAPATQAEGYYVIAAKTQQILFQSTNIQGKTSTDHLFSPETIQEMVRQQSGTRDYNYAGIGYFTVFRYFEKWDWLIGASLPKTTMFRQRQTYLFTVGWTALLVFIGLLTLSYVMARKMVVQPVAELVKVANAIAAGSFDQTIQVRQRDEIGALASTFQTMQTTIQRVLLDLQSLIQAIQDGRLTTRGDLAGYSGSWCDLVQGVNGIIEAFVGPINMTAAAIDQVARGEIPEPIPEHYQGEFNTITQKLNTMSAKLKEVVLHVKTVARTVAVTSSEIHHTAEQMAEGASQQAAAAEEASASTEEMAANIRQNAHNAQQTEQLAVQSTEYAEQSGAVVAEAVRAMQQIAKKIMIIQEIADQTRMLSLNATIEAARAQEHGKAFSVVASEVRKLSDITKTAAEEINELASSSLAISEKAGMMLATLVPNIQKTTSLVQEISAASREQSSGTEQVNQAIQQLDHITQQNVITAEQMSSTAEELALQAGQLQRTIEFFIVQDAINQSIEQRPAKIPERSDKKKPSSACRDANPTSPLANNLTPEFERY